jgi:hypothetical protein
MPEAIDGGSILDLLFIMGPSDDRLDDQKEGEPMKKEMGLSCRYIMLPRPYLQSIDAPGDPW